MACKATCLLAVQRLLFRVCVCDSRYRPLASLGGSPPHSPTSTGPLELASSLLSFFLSFLLAFLLLSSGHSGGGGQRAGG